MTPMNEADLQRQLDAANRRIAELTGPKAQQRQEALAIVFELVAVNQKAFKRGPNQALTLAFANAIDRAVKLEKLARAAGNLPDSAEVADRPLSGLPDMGAVGQIAADVYKRLNAADKAALAEKDAQVEKWRAAVATFIDLDGRLEDWDLDDPKREPWEALEAAERAAVRALNDLLTHASTSGGGP